ncbi:hypothetical protein QBC45DRAFT_398215 [Copromyces sp. CBS 386.78]|nr:hypothetical protein QBC45DRAFT_398215 [Copromyces sp. CBS 386.78]
MKNKVFEPNTKNRSSTLAPNKRFYFDHMGNKLSQLRQDAINERHARGFYTCSKCFNVELEEQRLCDDCRQDGDNAKARRAAGIPPKGGKWAKGAKRPKKDEGSEGKGGKDAGGKVKSGRVSKKGQKK